MKTTVKRITITNDRRLQDTLALNTRSEAVLKALYDVLDNLLNQHGLPHLDGLLVEVPAGNGEDAGFRICPGTKILPDGGALVTVDFLCVRSKTGPEVYVGRWKALPEDWEGIESLYEKSREEIRTEVLRQEAAEKAKSDWDRDPYPGVYTPVQFEETFNADNDGVFQGQDYFIKLFLA